jgi:Flp pilus assembly protein TadG
MGRVPEAEQSRRPWWRRDSGLSADRGSGPVEFAILALGMLTLAFMIVQAGLVYNARSVALAAATQGVNVARGYQNNPEAGKAHADQFIADHSGALRNGVATVSIDNTNGQAVVITVTGESLSVLPGFSFRIRQSARGSVEQFVED